MLSIVLVAVFIILFSRWFYLNTSIPKNFPPGPPRYPIIGSLTHMLRKSETSNHRGMIHGIFKVAEKYGDIFGFFIGSQPYVVIAGYDKMKDVFKLEEVSGRPDMSPINEFRIGHWTIGPEHPGRQPGILFSQGSYWREQRRFMLRNLRDFGFGKTEMEDTVLDEVDKLCVELHKDAGKPVCLDNTLNLSIVNALWAILVGERLPLKDPKLSKIVENFNNTVKKIKGGDNLLASLLPSRKIMLMLKTKLGLDAWEDAIQNLALILKEQIYTHKSSIDPDNSRDMMDLYLNEIENTNDVKSSFYKETGNFALINSFTDLFIAGMETTSSTLLWTFLYLLHHPDVKTKVHEEIDNVVGPGQPPRLAHRDQMPFTNAVLHESLRLSCTVYNALAHCATSEFSVGDYVIPQGTIVIPSLMTVLLDPKHFSNPHEFNPNRFLNSDGEFKPDQHVIAFGVGKRECLGKSLADKEYFWFLTGLLQKFDINPDPDQELPSYKMKDSINPTTLIRTAPGFNIILTPRMEE